jgi:DNA gyrase subunit A
VPADQVRITARQAMGVTLFRMAEGERVTSVFPVLEEAGNGDDGEVAPEAGEAPDTAAAESDTPESDSAEPGNG